MPEAKTAEQLQAELNEAMAKVDQLTGQVRGLATERDTYRAQLNTPSATGNGSDHILSRIMAGQADYGQADQYYVTRDQHQRELQKAVSDAYAMASGDTEMRFAIRDAYGAHPELKQWDSPLAQRTSQVLLRDGFAKVRPDAVGQPRRVQGWEDFTYQDTLALQRATGVAEHELWKEAEAAKAAAASTASAQAAAGMASGGAPVAASTSAISDDAFMKAAESGDTPAMRELLKQHAAAVTGQPSV